MLEKLLVVFVPPIVLFDGLARFMISEKIVEGHTDQRLTCRAAAVGYIPVAKTAAGAVRDQIMTALVAVYR
ncbi:MAG: hypothetical protein ACR2PI_07480 [Hyphomicrobiaceae bacterium]